MKYLRDLTGAWTGYNSAVRWFLAGDALFGVYVAINTLLLNLHLLALGYNERDIGILQGTTQVVVAVLAVPAGLLADRFGRRGFYLTGSYMAGLLMCATPWLRSMPVLLLLFGLMGVAMTLMFTTEFPILAAEVSSRRRGSLFSLVFFSFFTVNSLATILAGKLPEWLPPGPLSPYQWPLTLSGVVCLLAGLARQQMRLSPAPPEPAQTAPRGRQRLHPAILPMAAVTLLTGCAMVLGWHFANVILRDRFNLSDAAIAPLITGMGAVGALGNLLSPALERRIGQARLIQWSLTLTAPALLASGLLNTLWPFTAAFWLRNMFLTIQNSQIQAWSLSVVPVRSRSAMSSFYTVGQYVGMAIGDAVFGYLLAHKAYLATFALAAALSATGAAVFVLVARQQARGPGLAALDPAAGE